MKKNPLAIIFNDVHLKTGNESEVLRSIKHMIKYASDNKIKNLIFAGDLFDSRSFQRQSVLLTLDAILNQIKKAKLKLYLFPGNHDKTTYESFDSFLEPFRHYPNVIYNKSISDIELGGKKITLLPFFSDDILIPMIENHSGSDVLISHFEMAGSTNLGRVSQKTSINKKLLSKWKKVYLGHYHNHHEISKDIIHLPSLRPNNFGEDNNKGFSILYDDLSYEIIQGDFKKFIKIIINLDEINSKELKEIISKHSQSQDSIRFEITGEESKLKALDKSQFKGSGIDVKVKYEIKYDYSSPDLQIPTITEQYGKEEVKKSFEQFCLDKGYDYKEGLLLLEEFLKSK